MKLCQICGRRLQAINYTGKRREGSLQDGTPLWADHVGVARVCPRCDLTGSSVSIPYYFMPGWEDPVPDE